MLKWKEICVDIWFRRSRFKRYGKKAESFQKRWLQEKQKELVEEVFEAWLEELARSQSNSYFTVYPPFLFFVFLRIPLFSCTYPLFFTSSFVFTMTYTESQRLFRSLTCLGFATAVPRIRWFFARPSANIRSEFPLQDSREFIKKKKNVEARHCSTGSQFFKTTRAASIVTEAFAKEWSREASTLCLLHWKKFTKEPKSQLQDGQA